MSLKSAISHNTHQKHNFSHKRNQAAFQASKAAYGDLTAHQNLVGLGYYKDESLSDKNASVYTHHTHTIIAYRGTQDSADIGADAGIAVNDFNTPEFKKAHEKYQQVQAKYMHEIVATGHSLGGTKAIKVADAAGSHAIAFNPGTGVVNLKTGNHTVFAATGDPISARIDGNNVVKVSGGHSLSNFEAHFQYEIAAESKPFGRWAGYGL